MKKLFVFFLLGSCINVNAQITSRSNTKTGSFYLWSTTANWVSNTPPAPLITNINDEIFIEDYITRNGNLSFVNEGANTETLTIRDTLVVYGDMFFDNNSKTLVVDANAVLVVFGDMENNNKADITNNGTIVITGNLTLNGGQQDYNDSNGSNNGLFVGGTVSGNGDTAGANADMPASGVSFFGPEMEEFVNGGGSVPLPVELVSFDSEITGSAVRLSWLTASELNNDYFSVQRSENGVDFYEIGTVQGNGTTDEMHSYSFADRNPFSSIQYYRLQQFDYDGASEIHKTIVVDLNEFNAPRSAEAFPNPTTDEVNLRFDRQTVIAELNLVDLSGKIVAQLAAKGESGMEFGSKLPQLEKGLYFIRFRTDSGEQGVRKLYIE